MKDTSYEALVNDIVEKILETTGTGAVAVMGTGLGSPIDGKKVADASVDPDGDQAVPVQTLAMLNPDVFLPLSKTTKTNHVIPKGDQTGGYDHKNRPDQIIKAQEEQVKTGIISVILRAGVERAKAEADAKAQEKAQEIVAKKEEASFELKHGSKVLDQKQKEWALEKEKLLFKAKHKAKSVKEEKEVDFSKYPTEPVGSKVKKPSWNYDAEKYPDFIKDEKVKKPSWNYDAETYPDFEEAVTAVLLRNRTIAEGAEDQFAKYSTLPGSVKRNLPAGGYDEKDDASEDKADRLNTLYGGADTTKRVASQPDFESVVSNVINRVDVNLDNPTGSPEDKDRETRVGF